MTDHSFDKFVKESLNNHSVPVGEELWERIQEENNKIIEGAFWWKNYGFLTLVGVAAIFTATVILLTKNKGTGTAQTQDISVTLPSNHQTPSLNSGSHSAIAQPDKTLSKAATNANTNNTISAQSKVEEGFHSKPSTASNISGQDYFAGSYTNKKYNKNSTNSSAREFTSNGLQGNIPKSYNTAGRLSDSFIESSPSTFKSVFFEPVQQDRNVNEYTANDRLIETLKAGKSFCSDGCPSALGPVKKSLHLEIFASPDYARKAVDNSGGVDEAFLKRKDSTESTRLSFSAGFRLSKTIGNNMLLKAGMQYSQINEKFSYRSENERRQTTLITIRKEVLATGDTVLLRDTSVIEQVGYRVKTTYNRYRSIDIPVIGSYEWGGDNWKAAVSAGVILNLYSWQKGESLDTSYVPVAFNKDGGRTFKRNIGVGVFTGFSVLKKAGESTYFFAEPYFRYNVSDITNNRSLFNQKFDVTGMNIGIRYKLNTSGQRYFSK